MFSKPPGDTLVHDLTLIVLKMHHGHTVYGQTKVYYPSLIISVIYIKSFSYFEEFTIIHYSVKGAFISAVFIVFVCRNWVGSSSTGIL